jgi:hypothetical protein
MQGPDPQDFYPGKATDHALAQRIKDTYGDVEKGMRGYKVASIQNGAVCLACQLIAGKLVRKNRPTQVTGFIVDLAGKCVEGLQMNWVKYLVNQLELDCREAQDQGYEFHFSWLLILIVFTSWEMLEGATFLDIEPFEPLAAKFTTLWYSSDMGKQWQSNAVFHMYYLQLKRDIRVVPRMTPNTLHRFRPLMKFHADRHFIYITACTDEHKEELQSYYKLTEEDLDEITKDWSADLLIPADPTEMSDPELIGSSEATHKEHDTPGTSRRKKTEEVQNLSSASDETASVSPGRGGDDEVDREETNGKEDQQKQGEVTPPRDPVDEADPSKKRKVSPMKPTSRKKSRARKTTM